MKNSIKSNFIYNAILNLSNIIFPLITFAYVSRIIGPSYLGEISFVQSFIAYFILFSNLGLNIFGQREIAKYRDNIDNINHSFWNLLSLNTISTAILLIIYLLVILMLPKAHHSILLFTIAGFSLILNPLNTEWFFRGIENFKYITIRSLIIRTTILIVILITIKKESDYSLYYFYSILIIIIPNFINLFYLRHFVDFKPLKYLNMNVQIAYFKKMFLNSLYTILTSLYTTFPIIYLGFILSNSELGYFSLSQKLYSILLTIFSSFTAIMFPRMSYLLSKGETIRFEELINKSIEAVIPLATFIALFGFLYSNDIILLAGGSNFYKSSLSFQILMPSIMFVAVAQIFAIQVLLPNNKDNIILYGSIIGAITGIICLIIFTSFFSFYGASISICVSEFIVTIYMLFHAKFFFNKLFFLKTFAKSIISIVPLAIIFKVFISNHNIIPKIAFLILSALYFIIIHIYYLKNQTYTNIVNEICMKFNLKLRRNG